MASKTQTKQLKAKKVSQPNAFNSKKTLEKQDSDRLFGNYMNCAYWGGTKKKSYRQWTNINEILSGNKIQCGSSEGKRYGSEVQHIGGPTGDIPRPALLHLYNFDTSFINESSKVEEIEISFKYRVVNVDSNGKLWIDNLASDEKAIIRGFELWFGKADKSTMLSKTYKNSTQMKYEGKNKKGYIWKEVKVKVTDVTGADIKNNNFALNIQFGMNCSKAQTPCILYITGLKTNVVYENSQIYIEGKNSNNSLYTSTDEGCYTTINQIIEAGYKNGNKKIPVNSAPSKLGKNIKVLDKPNGVSVDLIPDQTNDLHSTFKITDKTNVPGTKTITYCLKNDEKTKTKVSYNAMQRPKPTWEIVDKYKSDEDYNPDKNYVIFKNGCANSIDIYIDSIDSTPIHLTVANQNSTSNLLNKDQNQVFHNAIKGLKCGEHTLYIKRGNESIENVKNNKATITILPMEFKFNIYSETEPALIFTQVKKDKNGQTRNETIKIQRIDDEPRESIPLIEVLDETNINHDLTQYQNVKKGDIIEHQIDKYYAGEFFLKVIDASSHCSSSNQSTAKIYINGVHKQNYDYIFTKGEDGTAFDFDYLVAWEGDNIKSPIKIEDIKLKHSPNDIRFCSKPSEIGLSQVGTVELRVSNLTENDVFKNVNVELNTLVPNENDELEVTTDEWVTPHGIFNNFYNLFYDYNQSIKDNVAVKNLTPDNDLVDEENVYLQIKCINPGDTISIIIPYRSIVEKTVFLQYLLYEQVQPIHSDCSSGASPTSDMIKIEVKDSMQTELEIFGNTDLLTLNNTFECPDECYTTTETDDLTTGGITYKITNIDTNDFAGMFVTTEITNSNELQPYGYYFNSQYYPLYNENNEIINNNGIFHWEQTYHESDAKPLGNQLVYAHVKFPSSQEDVVAQRTNAKGIASFVIEIPEELSRSYTLNELLNDALYFKFNGRGDYNPISYANLNNPYVKYDAIDPSKNNTLMKVNEDYRRYKPGEIIHIAVSLFGRIISISNNITFNAQLGDNKSSDEITVLYRICNIENNEGIFKTTFATKDKQLIPHQISKNIYCGIDTDIDVDTKIEKQIVESQNLNVIYLNVKNKEKLNKDVNIEIDLGKQLSDFIGDYSFIDINIDIGDYAIIQEKNGIHLKWLIGEMQPQQINKGIIKIKAESVGLSDIKIYAFDYLHKKGSTKTVLKKSKCMQCPQGNTYKVKDSPWEKIGNIWYKKIGNNYYIQEKVNGKLEWVQKNV